MSVSPLPTSHPSGKRAGAQLVAAAASRVRKLPSPGGLARRRLLIRLIKWLLPTAALLLLASVVLWPEIGRMRDTTRLALSRAGATLGATTMTEARYRGVDDHGRPYTVTAATAQQDGPERVNLTFPKGDITLTNGTWLLLQSKQGVFLQHSNQLDLSHDVILYRDDGTTMTTASAAIDLKNGAAASGEPTHAEGPFGTLDAQGFTLTDKGAAIQFTGLSHLVLNGSSS